MTKIQEKIYYLALLALSFLAIWGSIIYWLYQFNLIAKITIIVLTFISVFLIYKKINKEIKEITTNKVNNKTPFLIKIIYILFLFANIYFLYLARSDIALISPWQNTSAWFFVVYIALAALTLYISHKKYSYQSFAVYIFYIFSFSIALIVYKIGYGFDPFIHQASMEAINDLGKIHPKTFYYIGHYSIVILFHDIFQISIEYLNKLIVPILSALTLPGAIKIFLKKYFPNSNINIIILSLLILPFSIFIISTPQNLAYLFLILSLFIALNTEKKYLILSASLVLASLFIHPLAGIPALIAWFLIFIFIHKSKIRAWQHRGLLIASSILAIIAIPLAFVITGQSSLNINQISLNLFSNLSIKQGQGLWLDLGYFYGFNVSILIFALIFAGLIIWFRVYKRKPKILFINLILGSSFFLSYLFSQALSFEYLIDYERNYYRARILIISIIFFLPLILLVFKYLYQKLLKSSLSLKMSALIIISFLLGASLYYSYPRHDNYFNSRGYSLSKQDIETVKFVDKNAKNNNYVVLANQQVSLAALKTYGFSKYFKNDIYFYPIPTSGPLYKYYLEMVYEDASLKTIKKAQDLTGAETIYFVINKYWWASKKIINEASLNANETHKLFDGDVYIFKYN